jgi:hypothetical protein
MPSYPIDLSKSNPGPCSPSIGGGIDRPYYPTLHLEWDESYDLPDDGILTVKFHKRRETNTETDDGKERQSVELEITSIEKVKAVKIESDEPEKSDREKAAEALDKYAEEAGESE